MFVRRPVPAERAAPVIRAAGGAVGGRGAGAGKDAHAARRRLGVEFGEIAADALVVGGRMGIAAAAADRAHRLDRDPAQDIAAQRRVAIDGSAGAAKACLFAQLPRSARDRKSVMYGKYVSAS